MIIVGDQVIGGTSGGGGGSSFSTGVDSARPAASSALAAAGAIFFATDTRVAYQCVSSTAWRVLGATGEAGFDTTCAMLGSTYSARMAGTASVSTANASSVALVFSQIGAPGGVNIIAKLAGHQIEIGNNAGDRYEMSANINGTGTARVALGTISASPTALHCLAYTQSGFLTRWSLDGSTVAAASHVSGSMGGTTALEFSAASYGSSAWLGSIVAWSTAVSDADLAVVSAAYATGRIPGVSGATESLRWHAGWYTPGLLTQQYCAGSIGGNLAWTSAFHVSRR